MNEVVIMHPANISVICLTLKREEVRLMKERIFIIKLLRHLSLILLLLINLILVIKK